MPSHLIRQAEFTGGEIAPLARSRTDSPAYQHGVRLALNFLPTLEGPLINRAGTRFVCAVKDATYPPRLERFVFTDGQTFDLEVGDHYVRFIQVGGQVLSGGVVYELATPWAIADVARLVFSQDADVITATHPSYQPQEVTRVSNTNWTVSAVSFSPLPGSDFVTSLMVSSTSDGSGALNRSVFAALSPPGWANAITYNLGDYVLRGNQIYRSLANANTGNDPTGVGSTSWEISASDGTYGKNEYYWDGTYLWISLVDQNVVGGGVTPSAGTKWALATDDARVPKPTQWVVTGVYQDQNGRRFESLASSGTQVNLGVYVGSDRPAKLMWKSPDPGIAAVILLGFNIYRGHAGKWGIIGTLDPNSPTASIFGNYLFTDDVDAPNFGVQPPRGTNPFDVANGVNTKTQSWPGVNTTHEQRRVFARSDKKPQDFWGSSEDSPFDFDINEPIVASDSYDWRVSSGELQEIRALLSLRYLLLFSSGGVFGGYGPAGAISPLSINLRRYSANGSSYLKPLIVENGAVYQTDKNRIRDLLWDWRSDMYVGRDLSVIARHLFDGGLSIVDWCYAETPFSVIYAVRSDGTLLSLTYNPAGVAAWARHTTTGGFFERVSSVPEADPDTGVIEDAVYMVVRRTVGGQTVRYIERFSSRLLPTRASVDSEGNPTTIDDVRRGNFLDASVEYDGRNTSGTTVVVNVTDITPGAQGPAVASAPLFSVGSIGQQIVVDPDGIYQGPHVATIVGYTSPTQVTVEIESPWLDLKLDLSAPTAAWGIAKATLSGLGHLEGLAVTALADGGVDGPFTVAGGQVTLSAPAVIVQVGLGYNSDMETLDVAAEAVKTNQKAAWNTSLEVVSSRGVYVGQDFAHLVQPKELRVSDVTMSGVAPPLVTGPIDANIPSSFTSQGGRICVRQKDPLPLSITAVIREATVGGR